MMSFTAGDQFDFENKVSDRDLRFGTDTKHKAELRKDIPEPEIHPGRILLMHALGTM